MEKNTKTRSKIINLLKEKGMQVYSDDNDLPFFFCRLPFQKDEIIKYIFLGALHYSLLFRLDFIPKLSANEKNIIDSSKVNMYKHSLTSKIIGMFNDVNFSIINKDFLCAAFQDKPEKILVELISTIKTTEGKYSLFEFLKAISHVSSFDIMVFQNSVLKHFISNKSEITIYLKLENSKLFLLYPVRYDEAFIKDIYTNFNPGVTRKLSCGHPFPDIVFNQNTNLSNFVLSYLQKNCQCTDLLYEEEKKIIIEECKIKYPYWKLYCAECSINLDGSESKCPNCEFSYCMKCCSNFLEKNDKYLCKICNAYIRISRKNKQKSPEKINEVKEVKLYKDYEIPVKRLEKYCNHSSEFAFYCRECKMISYQYDANIIKYITCKSCNLFFKNKGEYCLFCIYSGQAEEEGKRQMNISTYIAGRLENIPNSEDTRRIDTEENSNPPLN
ncbi:hypothetical protein SteCoe_927 [Stentor coeruleus]|uniref:Uncharacterized protein n=1 Tax=Stentor coeruleus TaxID=5963 RepID=A0A1R2D334_9CILI|nr:hypothetical protein SteCoe_927 [Stentor coeruleus]